MGIQESLVEVAGEVAQLGDSERAHLAQCTVCAQVAAAERGLQWIFEQAVPAADAEVEAKILKALAQARRRRRVLALLPVAASLVAVLLGAALVGGFPGGSLLALLPLWSSHGWMTLVGVAHDWQVVATASARSIPAVITPAVLAVAMVLAACGVAGVVLTVRRWRGCLSWRRNR
jgi:hypothetical protein